MSINVRFSSADDDDSTCAKTLLLAWLQPWSNLEPFNENGGDAVSSA